MVTAISSKPAIESASDSSESVDKGVPKETITPVAPLGKPRPERRFWFQKRQNYDPKAIGTQAGSTSTSFHRLVPDSCLSAAQCL